MRVSRILLPALALHSLARVDHHGRKLCILGDMLELGPESPQLHYDVGRLAASEETELRSRSAALPAAEDAAVDTGR